jgi:hypothetical protein
VNRGEQGVGSRWEVVSGESGGGVVLNSKGKESNTEVSAAQAQISTCRLDSRFDSSFESGFDHASRSGSVEVLGRGPELGDHASGLGNLEGMLGSVRSGRAVASALAPATKEKRGGVDQIGNVLSDGTMTSRRGVDEMTVGEDGDGLVDGDGGLIGIDGLPLVRGTPEADPRLRARIAESVSRQGVEWGSEVASVGAVAAGESGDVAVRDMMWDSGCTYTLLTEEVGRMWDGARDRTVRLTGFVGEQRVGRGGGLMYAMMCDVEGVWRVECFGRTYVVDGVKDCLMGGRGAQEQGLGGTLLPAGGAELLSIRGQRYELTMGSSGTYRATYVIVPTAFGEAHLGEQVCRDGPPGMGVDAPVVCTAEVGRVFQPRSLVMDPMAAPFVPAMAGPAETVDDTAPPPPEPLRSGEKGGSNKSDDRRRRFRYAVTKGAAELTEEAEERLRFMKKKHLEFGCESATRLNQRFRDGEFGDKGMVVTPEMLDSPSRQSSMGTKRRFSHRHGRRVLDRAFEEVQVDLFDPGRRARRNRGGWRYVFSVICRSTGCVFRHALRGKTSADIKSGFDAFFAWLASIRSEVRQELGYEPKVTTIYMDVEGGATTTWGYRQTSVDALLISQRILVRFTGGDSPQYNGKVERSWRTMDTHIAAALAESGLREEFYFDCMAWQTVHMNHSRSSGNKLAPSVAAFKFLGLRAYRPEFLRPFGAAAWKEVKSRSKSKGQVRAQRCVFVGYSGDTEGYKVFDLSKRELDVSPDIQVETSIAGMRDLVTSWRADPFRVAKYGRWVWRLWRFEPKVELVAKPIKKKDGRVIDVVDPKTGLPAFKPPTSTPTVISAAKMERGKKSGVVPPKRQKQLIAPLSQASVGTGVNQNSRAELLAPDEARPSWAGHSAERTTFDGRKLGGAVSDQEASQLIKKARLLGLGLQFLGSHHKNKLGKPNMSQERFVKYKVFTTFEEVDAARKQRIVYSQAVVQELAARGKTVKSPDWVMRSGDLANDVSRGICEFVGSAGKVLSFRKVVKLYAEFVPAVSGKSSQKVGAGESGGGSGSEKASQKEGAGKSGGGSESGKSSQKVGAGKSGSGSGSGKSSQKVGAGKSGSESGSSSQNVGAGDGQVSPATSGSRRSLRVQKPVSYAGMSAQVGGAVGAVGDSAGTMSKRVSLKGVVQALRVQVDARAARVEKEALKFTEAAVARGYEARCVTAAAALFGDDVEEICGELYSRKDAAMIRANIAYCDAVAGIDSNRSSKAAGEMPFWVVMAVKQKVQVEVSGMIEPMSMMHAMRLKEAKLWIRAVQKEVAGLVAVDCWTEVDRSSVPSGRTIAPSHFVFKIKTEEFVDPATGKAALRFVKCKARLVYGGHMSASGSDYIETSAFVCSPKTIRAMLALAAPRDYKVTSFDITQAFTFSQMEPGKQVFMELPPLARVDGSRVGAGGDSEIYEGCGGGKNRDTVALLKRQLYGSKDAPRYWQKAVQAFCESIGARSLVSDRMAFRWKWTDKQKKRHEMSFAVHVDDILCTPSSDAINEEFASRLRGFFGEDRVTGGEETDAVLGMAITRDWGRKTITISQGGFARKMLENFGYENCKKVVDAPLPAGQEFEKWEGDPTPREQWDAMCFVGMLNWLSGSTRPDLAHACAMMSRYSSCPGPEHVKCMKHILMYLASHPDLGITYHGSASVLQSGYDHTDRLVAAVDADLGGCKDTNKSTTGIVVWLNGGAISWKSKKQSTVSTSTTEAEMKAAAAGCMEVVWLRDLVTELGAVQGCIRILEDNQGVVYLTHGQKDTSRSGHFRRPQVFVENLVGAGFMWLDRTETDFNPADIFTKGVEPSTKFGYLRDVIMGIQPDMYLSSSVKELLNGQLPSNTNVLLKEMRQVQSAEL